MGGVGTDEQFLPLFFPITYTFLLPPWSAFGPGGAEYADLPTDEAEGEARGSEDEEVVKAPTAEARLSTGEKLVLIRSLVWRFMLPLCLVYVAEYVINSVRPLLTPPCLPSSRIYSLSGCRSHSHLSSTDPRTVGSNIQVAERLLPLLVADV